MHLKRAITAAAAAAFVVASASHVWAQQPPPPPPPQSGPPEGLSGSAGFGLSFTSGNSDTLNLSATVDSIYDPKSGNVMKWNGLFLRGKQNHVLSVERLSGTFRDENTISGRVFVFGQLDALHDTFKDIEYLFAPSVGAGFNLLTSMQSQLSVDAGFGAVVEKDTGFEAHETGAVTLSEKLVQQLTATMTLKEAVTSLFKTNDFTDSLHTFQVGVAAKITSRFQLTVDFIDSYKNKTVDDLLLRNDISLVTGVVAKY